MTASPIISVILCTYNRAHLLHRALDTLLAQSLEKSLYEIVIVNNASTDETNDIVMHYQAVHRLPLMTLITEPIQGLGHARNTGYKHARGKYVAYIDDDCSASKDWLQNIVYCYECVRPEPWGVGGLILPAYDAQKPVWFNDSYETNSWGEQPRLLLSGESFTGCNMSFRKNILELYGGFDVGLDMKGNSLSLAGETELYRRMWSVESRRCAFHYSPNAVVHHIIEPYKMTVTYQLKRALTAGQASYAMKQFESLSRKTLLFLGSISLLILQTGLAIFRIGRRRRWQNWAVEELYPVASHCGRLLAFFGVKPTFRQRDPQSLTSEPCIKPQSSYAS